MTGTNPLFCLDGNPHCWHSAELQHAVSLDAGIHHDEVCCWCGVESCRDILNTKRRPEDHGEHLPNSQIERYTRTKVKNALKFYRANDAPKRACPLAPRQRELLQLIASGMTSTELANFLGITKGGLVQSRKVLRKKIGAKTTAHAVAIGFRNRYL